MAWAQERTVTGKVTLSDEKYLTDQRYFVVDKSRHPHDVTINERSLLKALGKDTDTAANYIQFSQNKIKSEVDLIKVLKHLQLGV